MAMPPPIYLHILSVSSIWHVVELETSTQFVQKFGLKNCFYRTYERMSFIMLKVTERLQSEVSNAPGPLFPWQIGELDTAKSVPSHNQHSAKTFTPNNVYLQLEPVSIKIWRSMSTQRNTTWLGWFVKCLPMITQSV